MANNENYAKWLLKTKAHLYIFYKHFSVYILSFIMYDIKEQVIESWYHELPWATTSSSASLQSLLYFTCLDVFLCTK